MDFNSIPALFNSWPADWLFIAVALIVLGLIALRAGTSRATAVALAIPAALLLYSFAPDAYLLKTVAPQLLGSATMQAALFGGIFVVSYLLTQRMTTIFSSTLATPLSAIAAGLACAILFMVAWMEVSALQSLWQFGPQVQSVFAEQFRFWWTLAALAALAYARS